MKDYYRIIGVSPYATEMEIKRCYRKLAVIYHPDKNKSDAAEERFKEIAEAYEVLGNPALRRAYDQALAHPNLFQQPDPIPRHRDPAYHRPYAQPAPRAHRQTTKELMAEYLPYFRWICWASLVASAILATDYSLPFREEQQEVQLISRIYRTGRGGGMIYDHHEIQTKEGINLVISEEASEHFKDVSHILIQQTQLFNKVVMASSLSGDFKIRTSALYGNLSFVPILLFFSALLGTAWRKGVEFPFNLTIVSFILLIIVIYLVLAEP